MKPLLPLVALTLAASASCALDLSGLPSGGAGGSTTTTTSSVGTGGAAATSSGTSGIGGADVTTATTSGTSSATASSSTGTVGSVWTRRRKLTLDSGVGSVLTDFPIAVLVGKGQIDYAQTKANGQDIRFTDEKGQILDYEIERWVVDDNNPSVLWVRVPSVSNKNGANATILWMYYGNSQVVGGAQNLQGVWKDGFTGVWHLSQDDDNLVDATGTTGLAKNYGSTRVAGMVGDARGFTAANGHYIDTLNAMNITRFTVEAWANCTHSPSGSNGPNGPLMRQKNYQLVWDHTDNKYIDGTSFNPNPTGENWRSQSFDMLNSGKWYYLAGTFDGGTLTSFTDGMKKHSTSFSTVDPQPETESAKIGRHAFLTATMNYFDGMIDEVRISNKARSEDWIAAQNKSMRNAGFVTFGNEVIGSYPLP